MLVGAGVSELIQLVALSFVKDRVLMLKHTYGEYGVAVQMIGAEIKRIEMPGLRIYPALIVEEMKLIIEEAERADALLVIDEAYVDFVRNAFPSHVFSTQNLVILRSMTKSYAIPGIRLGYAISLEENIREMRKVKAPWSVTVFAQKRMLIFIS